MISVSICLSDIPQDKISHAYNGKKYLNVNIAERKQPDQYGNTHTVYIQQSKEERESKADKIYCGAGKLVSFDKTAAPQQSAADYFNATQATEQQTVETPPIDDIPF